MPIEIKLQALKENVETVEVNAVKVTPGDVVAVDQTLLEVQADKAALDVPSPAAGRVAKVLVKAGDQVKVGQVYVVLEGSSNGEAAHAAAPATSAKAAPSKRDDQSAPAAPLKIEEPRPEVTAAATAAKPAARREAPASSNQIVPAGPATRRLARELGVDLHQVPGSGRFGRVIEADIKEFVRQLAAGVTLPSGGVGPVTPPLPNFESFGAVERQALNAIRKATARHMSLAWTTIPHVTQHDLADVTELEAFRKSQGAKGPKITVTAFVLKACAVALKEFPAFNASLDLAKNQLVFKRYYHLGMAVDTENGLLVPVLRDVDTKSVHQLAEELATTAERARQGKADMSGGTFTVTNLGGIGGTAFTPIVNWPEVAILGLSRSRLEPVYRDGQLVPRLMLPLSLSYDHRVIDGAAAARFTRRIAEMLENPLVMLLHA